MTQQRQPRILLIDDIPEVRALISMLFGNAGYDIDAVDHMKQSSKRWRDYDIVLLDVMMPGEHGHNIAIRHMKHWGDSDRRPIIVLFSALSSDRLKEIASEIKTSARGASVYFFQKGRGIADLIEMVGSLANGSVEKEGAL